MPWVWQGRFRGSSNTQIVPSACTQPTAVLLSSRRQNGRSSYAHSANGHILVHSECNDEFKYLEEGEQIIVRRAQRSNRQKQTKPSPHVRGTACDVRSSDGRPPGCHIGGGLQINPMRLGNGEYRERDRDIGATRANLRRLGTVSCDEAPELCNSDGPGAGVSLLFRRAGHAATKPLGFAPGVTNLFAQARELGGHLNNDKCDHGYWPAFEYRRPICRSASSERCCSPWLAMYPSTTRPARRSLESR